MPTDANSMLDSQQVELVGRSLLVAQLLAEDIEVAIPERDRGIDLIAYLDREGGRGFVARPIQLKAASRRSFAVNRKYQWTSGLVLAFVWHVADPQQSVTYALDYESAEGIAAAMGWTATASWERGSYTTQAPSQRLLALLEPHRMIAGSWRALLWG